MFNYIGMYLVDMWVRGSSTMYNSTITRTNYIPQSAQIPSLGFTGTNVNYRDCASHLNWYIALYHTSENNLWL